MTAGHGNTTEFIVADSRRIPLPPPVPSLGNLGKNSGKAVVVNAFPTALNKL